MGIPHGPTTSMQILAFSPFGQVCTNLDLEILENVGCKGDDEIANEVRKIFSLCFHLFTFSFQNIFKLIQLEG